MKKMVSLLLVLILLLSNFSLVYAFDGEYQTGDVIEFGSYPQSEVTDERLMSELNLLAPEWDEWISYGYYNGNGEIGSMIIGDWMRYTDVSLGSQRYRGVKFVSYRPYTTYGVSEESNTDQADNGYNTDTVYWFEFEPLKWRILSPETGFIMCETIIDAQPFSNTVYKKQAESKYFHKHFNDADYKNFANNYETSSIREWLNKDFYNTAFSDSEKEKISTTLIENNEYRISYEGTGYESFKSNNTQDKIFLLSENEASNSNFGFNPCNGECRVVDEGLYEHTTECFNDYNVTRMAEGSDYAKCQGLRVDTGYETEGKSCWLLRSYSMDSLCTTGIYYNGYAKSIFGTGGISGVRPAMMLEKHTHSFETTVKNPSCTVPGGIIYTCLCGEEYTHSISFTGHTFDGSECVNCDYDKADNCSCSCHKSGIAGFIWKIINFFCWLFRMKQECSCGARHWQ